LTFAICLDYLSGQILKRNAQTEKTFESMASRKMALLTVPLKPDTLEDFKTACELKGATMSSWIRQFVMQTIREERQHQPKAFVRPDQIRMPVEVAGYSAAGSIAKRRRIAVNSGPASSAESKPRGRKK
jgi:hypothetical protein